MKGEQTNKEQLEEKVEELQGDLQDVKETAKDDPQNFKPVLVEKWEKWSSVIIGVVGVTALTIIGFRVTIPEPLIVFAMAMALAGIVAYPLADNAADYFIEDNRVPAIAQNPMTPYDVGVALVPSEREHEVEVQEGSKMPLETREYGRGFQVEDLTIIDAKRSKDNRQHIVAKGIKGGMQPNVIKSHLSHWHYIRDILLPRSEKLKEYEANLPVMAHRMETEALNNIARKFEEIAVYNSEEFRDITDEQTEVTFEEKTGSDNLEYDETVTQYLDEQEEQYGAW